MPPRLQHHSPNNGGASPDSGVLLPRNAADPLKSSNTRKQKSSAEVDGDGKNHELVCLVQAVTPDMWVDTRRVRLDLDTTDGRALQVAYAPDYRILLSRTKSQRAQEEGVRENWKESNGLTPAKRLNKVTVGSLSCLGYSRRPDSNSRLSTGLPNTSRISRCKSASSSCLSRPSLPRSALSTRTVALKYS